MGLPGRKGFEKVSSYFDNPNIPDFYDWGNFPRSGPAR
ncbi:hypothetical protein LEP1GSC185_2768 [Leptospira licerasiae serovar Varillal str. VAR 010]|uniref:Uncharacterized protein n=1 Tax=Leptospira licerasiae str. MMD4847 TaxID=1049971 RepID=A0ABN0H895_9LEPT|nr:hypothetical protein LEP1GSC185_2768 [Leptospira licerasiae serovar Varillal str. VAR 010]EJZ41734.1 hypothetical protein LEP1GSC178_0543 [Leptospira licerasiae str. MMD4847]